MVILVKELNEQLLHCWVLRAGRHVHDCFIGLPTVAEFVVRVLDFASNDQDFMRLRYLE